MSEKVVGGKILIIGDLHISDIFTGKHKDYLGNCFSVLSKLSAIIEEKQPSAIILLGDIVGNRETNIKSREVLSKFCDILQKWNNICPVYTVTGNHDLKGFSDLTFLARLGLVRTSQNCGGIIDYYGNAEQELPEVRFHLVDYGDEHREFDLCHGTSNIVLGHNNYTIQGVTNWYQQHDGLEVAMMDNFANIDMVISGHIHAPSPDIAQVRTVSGEICQLLYLGCPTRPVKEPSNYDTCWVGEIEYFDSLGHTDVNTIPLELGSSADLYYDDGELINEKSETEIQEELRRENLKGVLEDLTKYRLGAGDPIQQIQNIVGANDASKKVAIKYLNLALDM